MHGEIGKSGFWSSHGLLGNYVSEAHKTFAFERMG
jgi:hypothetical protein